MTSARTLPLSVFRTPLGFGEVVWVYCAGQALVLFTASVLLAELVMSGSSEAGQKLKYVLYLIGFGIIPLVSVGSFLLIYQLDQLRRRASINIALGLNALALPAGLLLLMYAPAAAPVAACGLVAVTVASMALDLFTAKIDHLVPANVLAGLVRVSTIVCALELLLLPIVLVTPFFVKFVAFARTV